MNIEADIVKMECLDVFPEACVAPLLIPSSDDVGRAVVAQDLTNLLGVLPVFGEYAFDVGLD